MSKANKNSKKASKANKQDGRGRPEVYTGNLKRGIVSVIRREGLTGARKVLAEQGIPLVSKPGSPSEIVKVNISMPTLGKLAKQANIKLFRGRPEKVAA